VQTAATEICSHIVDCYLANVFFYDAVMCFCQRMVISPALFYNYLHSINESDVYIE